MTVSAASFRLALPVFASDVTYPNDAVNFWLGIAALMLNPQVWGISATTAEPAAAGGAMTSALDLGTVLFVAHNLILEQQAGRAASRGNVPGMNKGAISSESAGPISAGYDTSAGIEEGAGHWNLTIYGTRFIRLAGIRATSVGMLTAGGGCGPFGQSAGVGAWPGPPGGLFPWWGGG